MRSNGWLPVASPLEKKLAALKTSVTLEEAPGAAVPVEETQTITLDIPAELHTKLMIRRAYGKGSLKEQVQTAIRDYLARGDL